MKTKQKKKEDEILSFILIIMNIALLFSKRSLFTVHGNAAEWKDMRGRHEEEWSVLAEGLECRHASEARPAQYD